MQKCRGRNKTQEQPEVSLSIENCHREYGETNNEDQMRSGLIAFKVKSFESSCNSQ